MALLCFSSRKNKKQEKKESFVLFILLVKQKILTLTQS